MEDVPPPTQMFSRAEVTVRLKPRRYEGQAAVVLFARRNGTLKDRTVHPGLVRTHS
jgi:hypothetical protein